MVVNEQESLARAHERLERLTPKERQVLDLVLERFTSKEIARVLGIVPNTVDLRLRMAKSKLGADNRNEIARIYRQLLQTCGETTCGPAVMFDPIPAPLAELPEPPSARFTLNDAAGFSMPAPWEGIERMELSEVWDRRFGKVWRVAAIPLGALCIALLAVALLAIANNLAMLIPS